MSDLMQALKDRISILGDEIEELEDSLLRKRAKQETYEELLAEEQGLSKTPSSGKKKRGRPKGSKGKKAQTDALYDEAVSNLGEGASTPELQKKRIEQYSPDRRVLEGLGPGIRAGTKQQVLGDSSDKPSAVVSIGDGE